jgi:hypothetical protein
MPATTSTRRGFTLIELLTFLSFIATGIWTSMVFNRLVGVHTVAGACAGLLGFVLGAAFLPFLGFSYGQYRKWAYFGDKFMPDCSCGNDQFKLERVDGRLIRVCPSCGARYAKQGDQVWMINGTEKQLYKSLVRFKGWI